MYERTIGIGRLAMTAMTVLSITASSLLPSGQADAAVRAIAVTPNVGPPLATVKVTGSGFCPPPCGLVSISVGALYVASGVTVTRRGRFTIFVRMPGTVRPGQVMITAAQTQRHGTLASAQTTFAVTPGQPPPIVYPTPSVTQPPGGLPPPTGKPAHHHAANPTPRQSGSTQPAAAPPGTPPASPGTIASPATATGSTGHGINWVYWLLLSALGVAVVAAAAWLWRRRRDTAQG